MFDSFEFLNCFLSFLSLCCHTYSWAHVHSWTSAHLKPRIISKHFGHLAVHISHADVTWLLFLRSRHSSHILVCGKCRNWWEHNFHLVAEPFWLQTAAFGSGAVDSWPTISGRPEIITLETLESRCGSIVWEHRRCT